MKTISKVLVCALLCLSLSAGCVVPAHASTLSLLPAFDISLNDIPVMYSSLGLVGQGIANFVAGAGASAFYHSAGSDMQAVASSLSESLTNLSNRFWHIGQQLWQLPATVWNTLSGKNSRDVRKFFGSILEYASRNGRTFESFDAWLSSTVNLGLPIGADTFPSLSKVLSSAPAPVQLGFAQPTLTRRTVASFNNLQSSDAFSLYSGDAIFFGDWTPAGSYCTYSIDLSTFPDVYLAVQRFNSSVNSLMWCLCDSSGRCLPFLHYTLSSSPSNPSFAFDYICCSYYIGGRSFNAPLSEVSCSAWQSTQGYEFVRLGSSSYPSDYPVIGNSSYTYNGSAFSSARDAYQAIINSGVLSYTIAHNYYSNSGRLKVPVAGVFEFSNWSDFANGREVAIPVYNIDNLGYDVDIANPAGTYPIDIIQEDDAAVATTIDVIGLYDELAAVLSSVESTTADIRDAYIANTYVGDVAGTLTPAVATDFKYYFPSADVPPFGVDLPSGIFSGVWKYVDYLWDYTKPLVAYTADMLSCLTLSSEDGGASWIVYGVVIVGIAGGIIFKFLI